MKFSKNFKRILTNISLFFITASIITLGFIYYHNQSNIFLWAVLIIFPYFFIAVIFTFLSLFVIIVKENLQWILMILQKRRQKYENSTLVSRVINSQLISFDGEEEIIREINKLKKIYSMLSEVTSLSNEICGPSIFGALIIIITGNISTGYKVYLSWMQEIPIERVCVPVYTMLLTLGMIATIVKQTTSVYSLTADLIAEIAKFEFNKTDRERGVSSVFVEFSLQIAQQPLQFTVAGYYVITKSFFSSIITGIMSYLVILVQFTDPRKEIRNNQLNP